ncbi:MAG: MmgE/PrpD family protein [Microvirga sp.]
MTATASQQLARYAASVAYDDLPETVVDLARTCLVDAVACAIHGSALPWSRMVAAYAGSAGREGPCSLPGTGMRHLHPSPASLQLGASAHAFELDCLRKPGAGVHPGATVALPALMAAQAAGASGRETLAAIVAGCEVMFRIGNATLHSPESRGFHAPGLTGPFGAATAVGRILGLRPDRLTNAYGLCGSLSGGLLAFAKSGDGGMVKRLHLGRAAEAGVAAALLAREGFEAPSAILEGRYGLLETFCDGSDPSLLTQGLGEGFEIATLCIKRYACHVTAQAPVERLRTLMGEHAFQGTDIAGLTLTVSDKVLSHHAERRPADVMLAQYSVPFALAIAAFHDPEDPAAFSAAALADPAVRSLAEAMEVRSGAPKGWGAALSLRLKDGRRLDTSADTFLGTPERPMAMADLTRKWRLLTRAGAEPVPDGLLPLLRSLDEVPDVGAAFRALTGPSGG